MKLIYDIPEILKRLPGQIDDLVQKLFPEAKKERSSWRIGSLSGEKGTSLSISTKSHNAGVYVDHGDHTIRGDVFNLVANARNLQRREAIKWVAEFVGVQPHEMMERKMPHKLDPALERILKPLHENCIEYAANRKISQQTLRACKVASNATGTEFLMPHYIESGKLGMIQHRQVAGERKIWSNENPVYTLFAKHLIDPMQTSGEVIITEGHWDAMSWIECGYHAVSIPSGAGNHDWIQTDYHWLSQFSTIFLNYDSDEPGQKAVEEVMARLGPDRCKIVKLARKDANEHLKAGERSELDQALEHARTSPLPELVIADSMEKQVLDELKNDNVTTGVRCFLPTLNGIQFRPHEWTLWFGYTTHGKSSAVENQIAFEASLGRYCMIASFEQPAQVTIANMLKAYTACERPGEKPWFHEAYMNLTEHVRFFKKMQKTDPASLIKTMTAAHCQLGVETFVIDNVMTLDVDRQDNTSQAAVADQLRIFVAQYPIHLHIVAHPRKAKDNALSPPQSSEVRGAAEWADMPNNIITIWRAVQKHDAMAEMENENYSEDEITSKWLSEPDGRFYVRKQRKTGKHPMARFWFHDRCKRFWPTSEPPVPFFHPTQH